MIKWIVLIGALVFVLGIYGFSLMNVTQGDIRITEVQDLSSQGFTMVGTIEVHNAGITPVFVQAVTYDIFLENGKKIGEGSVIGGLLPRGTSALPLTQEIRFDSSLDAGLATLRGETAILKGKIILFGPLSVPLETSFPLRGSNLPTQENPLNEQADSLGLI